MQFVKVTNAELLHLHLHPGSRNITNDKKMNFICFIVPTSTKRALEIQIVGKIQKSQQSREALWTMDTKVSTYLLTYLLGTLIHYISDNQHLFLEILFRPQQEVRIRLLREESYFLSDQESVSESNCNEWKDV